MQEKATTTVNSCFQTTSEPGVQIWSTNMLQHVLLVWKSSRPGVGLKVRYSMPPDIANVESGTLWEGDLKDDAMVRAIRSHAPDQFVFFEPDCCVAARVLDSLLLLEEDGLTCGSGYLDTSDLDGFTAAVSVYLLGTDEAADTVTIDMTEVADSASRANPVLTHYKSQWRNPGSCCPQPVNYVESDGFLPFYHMLSLGMQTVYIAFHLLPKIQHVNVLDPVERPDRDGVLKWLKIVTGDGCFMVPIFAPVLDLDRLVWDALDDMKPPTPFFLGTRLDLVVCVFSAKGSVQVVRLSGGDPVSHTYPVLLSGDLLQRLKGKLLQVVTQDCLFYVKEYCFTDLLTSFHFHLGLDFMRVRLGERTFQFDVADPKLYEFLSSCLDVKRKQGH